MTQKDGKKYSALGLKEIILSNEYTTQGNLQIQQNPYQIMSGLFQRTGTIFFQKFLWKQKIQNSQSNIEKEKWNWRNQDP